MEKLFYYLITGWIIVAAVKTFIFWATKKLLTSKDPTKRTKLMDSRSEYTSKLFNELLKNKKLDYHTIDSIYKILKKYAKDKEFNNNIHLIYSTLKHSPIKNQDLANIQLILDSARVRCKK